MPEQILSTSDTHPILRIGNTVRRPTNFWTPAVHSLLKYLESVDFPYSPRVLGFDSQGREVLSYIEGQSGKDGWKKIVSDQGLQRFARLLRSYHDAVAGFKPSDNPEWADGMLSLRPKEIICHGDFGPWNVIWKGDEPIGIVDWDIAHPARVERDILYALEYAAPFRDDETAIKWHHFPDVPDRKKRIKLFLEAYDHPPIENITAKVAAMQRSVGRHEAYLAERDIQPQADWVSNGDLEVVERRAQWSETNSDLFEGDL